MWAIPPYLLTSYYYNFFALWLRRYPGTWLYIFWERGASWFGPSLFLALGGNERS